MMVFRTSPRSWLRAAWLTTLVAVFTAASVVTLTAQTPKVLTNQDVVDMVSAKLSDGVIVAAIQKATCKFSTDPQDLIALKKAGVSDSVVEAMTDAGAPAPGVAQANLLRLGIVGAAPSGATPAAGATATGDFNDPLQPHDSGIYLYTKDREGKPQMIALERAAEQSTKTGGYFGTAMTYGIKKTKMKAQIPGAHAGIQISESSPASARSCQQQANAARTRTWSPSWGPFSAGYPNGPSTDSTPISNFSAGAQVKIGSYLGIILLTVPRISRWQGRDR